MKSAVLRKRFFDTAVRDVLRAFAGGALVGSSALALCVLDYLAYLRAPGKDNTAKYKRLVRDYLKKTNEKYIPKEIYAWRCSLVHTYAEVEALERAHLDGIQMTHRHPELHLTRRHRVLIVNVDTFIADVVWAARSFFVDTDQNLDVEQRAESLIKVWTPMDLLSPYYADAQEEARPYSSMHSALSELEAPKPDLQRLRDDITGLCPNGDSTLSPPTSGHGNLRF